ncbi:unnamed protein product [Allacma fusca]|uniref:DDE-1 domain-containing protein n=1 Tax=Allacma fusca TaxID=39272 RepID=A0A8J2P7F5_9HEXA|nr:unnamed protein product [Allacma fusca]
MSGEIVGKLLITLQERDGKFGPNVIKKLKIPENVYLTCSKSGKLDKKIVETWVVNCLKPAITSNVLLLCDSWGGQKDQNLYLEVENICQVQVIPPHTTGQIQPLDVYFFRQAKIFKKKMKDRILIDQLPISIHDRQIGTRRMIPVHFAM